MNIAIISVLGIFLAFIAVSIIAGLLIYTSIYNAKIKLKYSTAKFEKMVLTLYLKIHMEFLLELFQALHSNVF